MSFPEEHFIPGFYHLYTDIEPEPVMVQYYYSSDTKCFGFGFNTHDGAGFLPLSDLSEKSYVKRLQITETP